MGARVTTNLFAMLANQSKAEVLLSRKVRRAATRLS